jgi:DNA-binding GntR family transcriptional regulator
MIDIIQKTKFSDQASKYIRDLIVDKQLRSGDRIVETKIAKQLGISQAPVREALRELEGMGLVEIKPYSGCTVSPLTKKKLLQVYALRTMVECHAVDEAIGMICEKDFEAMADRIGEMKHDADIHDTMALVEHDVEFHEILVKSAENAMLEKMWRLVGAGLWSSITVMSYPDLNYFSKSHDGILEMAKVRNVQALKEELTQHFNRAANIVVHHISDDDDVDNGGAK